MAANNKDTIPPAVNTGAPTPKDGDIGMAANNKDPTPPAINTSNTCIDGNDKEAAPLATNRDASSAVDSEDVASPAIKTDTAPPAIEKDTTGVAAIETEAVPPAVDGDTGVAANKEDAAPLAINSDLPSNNDNDSGMATSNGDAAPPAVDEDIDKAGNNKEAAPTAVDEDTGKEANNKDSGKTNAVGESHSDNSEDSGKEANNKDSDKRNAVGESHSDNNEDTGKEDNNKDSGKTKTVGESHIDNSEDTGKEANNKDSGKTNGIGESHSDNSAAESKDTEKKTEEEEEEEEEEGTPTIDKLGINLTKLAQEGKLNPFDEREELVDSVIQILCRQRKCNPCLIGHPGVWKTAIIESLAQRIQSGTVPERLKEKKIISIASKHPESTTYAPGMLGVKIVKEIKRSGDIIVFFDEDLTLSNASILKPDLERGDIQCIGATKTLGEYTKRSSVESVFQAVKVPEPSIDDTIEILKGLRGLYETHHKVCYTDEVFVAAVKLSSRYMSDGILLDKAIDLIDEAGSRAQLLRAKAIKTKNMDQDSKLTQQNSTIKTETQTDTIMETNTDENNDDIPIKVTKEDVQQVVSSRIEIPVHEVSKEESERLLKLEETLHESIIGQHEALIAISDAIRRARVGLKSSKRPIASFIFTGPTGVGKTEVAKTLARQYFGSEDSMIRFDMSEYMEKHQVSKLIGSPPGYVMCQEGGQLTEAVRRKPHTVVLFDEIEKAHPDILNLMLQILDDGRLTDNMGETVTFSNTIIIMTSNVGGNVIYSESSSGLPDDKINNLVMKEIKKNFRAEFLNRFDEIIIFKQLTEGEVSQIADLMFKEVGDRLKAKDIKLNVSDKFRDRVVNDGYSPNYGARQLRRVITTLLENLLAKKMLSKEIKDGDSVLVDVDSEGNIQVLKEPSSARGE